MCVSRVVRIVLVSIICAMANVASATLVGYYRLDEPDPLLFQIAVDSSPSGVNSGAYFATGSGPTSIASVNAGLYGTAVHFDSVSSLDYVQINSLTGGPTQNSALTYAAWIKPDTVQQANPTIVANSKSAGGYDLRIVLPSGGDGSVWNLQLAANGATTTPASYITTATIPAGAWTHFAFTKDVNDSGSGGAGSNTSALKFYVNGSLVESSDISQPGSTNPGRYFIAAGRPATSYFGGGLDEVHIYNEALDATAIAALAALPGLPGDYNHNSVVDAADYVLWRKDPTNPAYNGASGYGIWRTNFGNHSGSGSGLGSGAGSVPEPTSLMLMAVAIVGTFASRRRR
jgi:hypothetical protein